MGQIFGGGGFIDTATDHSLSPEERLKRLRAQQGGSGGILDTGYGPDFGFDDAAATLFGGPVGYEALQAHKQRKAGNDAASAAMANAQDQLAKLRDQQHRQRQIDLKRAMAYFGPANQLANRMYGTPLPAPYTTDAEQRAASLPLTTARGRLGGGAAPMFNGPSSGPPNPLAPPPPGGWAVPPPGWGR